MMVESEKKVITLFGCKINNLTMDETVEEIGKFIESGKPHQHIVVNVNKVIIADKDPDMRDIINSCDLVNVDGMPIVWASKIFGKPLRERVTGIDLFTNLLKKSAEKSWKIFLLGAKDEILEILVKKLKQDYPKIIICGCRNGYWKNEEEENKVAELVYSAKPDILFVAISSPKKEYFIRKNLTRMNVPFVMGVGGSFDVMAGKITRAPLWMQNSGLEWFHRFLSEPARMFKRYFIDGCYFFKLIVTEFFKS